MSAPAVAHRDVVCTRCQSFVAVPEGFVPVELDFGNEPVRLEPKAGHGFPVRLSYDVVKGDDVEGAFIIMRAIVPGDDDLVADVEQLFRHAGANDCLYVRHLSDVCGVLRNGAGYVQNLLKGLFSSDFSHVFSSLCLIDLTDVSVSVFIESEMKTSSRLRPGHELRTK